MPDSLAVQILVGVYVGVLTGVLPALVSWALGFSFRYVTGVTIPGLAVVAVGAALAGVSGGLLGLLDPEIAETPVAVTAVLIVLMASLWAHDQGDKTAQQVPRRLTLATIRDRTLPTELVERVGGFGEVSIEVETIGEHTEGALSEERREAIVGERFRFPADLTVGEIEGRLADRLAALHDLADVSVTIDGHGRASVLAAPAGARLSRRLGEGQRAVSVRTLVPPGLARGDEVRVGSEGPTATVVSDPGPEEDGEEGVGRVALGADRSTARTLLDRERADLLVLPRGERPVERLAAALGRNGGAIERVRVSDDGRGARIERGVDAGDLAVLAVRQSDGTLHREIERVEAGEEAFLAGRREALRSVRGDAE
ncbi:potassium transporter TrkA [Natronorarus salvus]|uniref:potassium transporter TrkA n=1 Tax=Natronorarus salvus TaxID=3117733 RepID=UPI002F267A5A